MTRLTAIELADDAGTLIGASVRGTRVVVNAVERFDRRALARTTGFARALQQARGMLDLPRRTRVVLWGGRPPVDPESSAAVQPLTDAGFEIERVVSPCDALAALARTRHPRPDATILWVAINRRHVAIVVMRPGRLFYSRAFPWDSTIGAVGSHAQLLQRYSLVAFLAPELRRAIEATSAEGGVVDGVATCGDVPELRSLTMPLIEELDLEVETLDSAEGVDADPSVQATVGDVAPAIRLAMAGAVARLPRARKSWTRLHAVPLTGVAAAAVLGAGGWRYASRPIELPAPADVRPAHTARGDVDLPAPPVAAIPEPSEVDANPGAPPPTPARAPAPTLAMEPLPKVTAILTSEDRRTALVNGRTTQVGDRVGRWTVKAIEPDYVLFTEASGAELRVPLGRQ
ncbi:MAG TPA: hypothetical protein VL262_12970 [Vicinamibacterales bacterium]|nr:hypothetical protein [Vicinamibacterales bacterium]